MRQQNGFDVFVLVFVCVVCIYMYTSPKRIYTIIHVYALAGQIGLAVEKTPYGYTAAVDRFPELHTGLTVRERGYTFARTPSREGFDSINQLLYAYEYIHIYIYTRAWTAVIGFSDVINLKKKTNINNKITRGLGCLYVQYSSCA